ncbi:hypothetical protein PCL_12647 [Purpureocillium lilacinum]|uniref:Uncharacterized protein n=1 Tax=Purpureocillium lilacinum TaxID=33203 RepID=A0A2U3DPE2_PURLI|nr:hypothetical protein PCL_12647 [Purpureocillium lilacinum]
MGTRGRDTTPLTQSPARSSGTSPSSLHHTLTEVDHATKSAHRGERHSSSTSSDSSEPCHSANEHLSDDQATPPERDPSAANLTSASSQVPASRRRDAQRDSEVPRVRGPPRARAGERRKEDNAGAAAVTDPSHAAIAMYEEWPLSDAILKCVNDNGTLTVPVQFTWATACGAHGHHVHPDNERGSKSHRTSTRPKGRLMPRRATKNAPDLNILNRGLV